MITESDAQILQNQAIIIIPQKFAVLNIINDNEFKRSEDSESLTTVNN